MHARARASRFLVPAGIATLAVAISMLVGCATTSPSGGGEDGEVSTVTGTPHMQADSHEMTQPQAQPSQTPQWIPPMLHDAGTPRQGFWARLRDDFSLPGDRARPRIAQQIKRYDGHDAYFRAVARRGQPYLRYILERIEARNMPAELLLLPVIESGFQPFAYSRSRAGGLWQFKPATGRRFGLKQDWWYDGRRDVLASTDAALDYLEYLHDFFDDDWLLALAAYNAGEGTVARARRANAAAGLPTDYWHLDLPAQTEAYVPRLLAVRAVVTAPGDYGIELPSMPRERSLKVVSVPDQVDLAMAAEMADIPLSTLYRYNSGFNRWATPPEGPHRLAVPLAKAEDFRSAIAQRDPDDMLQWRRHRIDRGQTLSGIADQYRTTVSILRAVNDLDDAAIRAGQYLMVPVASRKRAAYTLSVANRRKASQASGPTGRKRIDYSIKSGDTFWDIAQAHDVDVGKLAGWNDMAPSDPLQPGQKLAIWVPRQAGKGADSRIRHIEYTVTSGDSLSTIGKRFNVEIASIRRWNGLQAGKYLHPGQKLDLRVDVTEQADAR